MKKIRMIKPNDLKNVGRIKSPFIRGFIFGAVMLCIVSLFFLLVEILFIRGLWSGNIQFQ